jgi:hypothetical protein
VNADATPSTGDAPDSPPERRLPYRKPVPASSATPSAASGWIALALGWLLPGLGYAITPGERWRGVAAGVAIVSLYVLGLFVGGVRVIDVPGWRDGEKWTDGRGTWVLTAHPRAAISESPWYLGQFMVGPVNLVGSFASISVASTYPKPTARLAEFGTLATAVAGMLNLVVMLDAFGRASTRRDEKGGPA